MFVKERGDDLKRQSSTTDNLEVIKKDMFTNPNDISFKSEKLFMKASIAPTKEIRTENVDEDE